MKNMRIEDKVALCSGKDFWNTKEMKEYDIPSFVVADGPNGLRKQNVKSDNLGINKALEATAFSTSSLSACSFDEELLFEVGKTIALEALSKDVKVLLGPGTNIKRNPLCGRNFEYFSEDPYLSGKLASAFIKGVQSTNTKACLKHFALNNQEYKRFVSSSCADEKTMREIYLKPFEIAVKEAKPACIMSSYNLINGIHASENKWLLNDVLRKEWGFDGLIMTDWGGMSDRTKSFEAGLDLCMPGGSCFGEAKAIKDFKDNKIDNKYLDESVKRIIKIANEEMPKVDIDLESHYKIAKKVALNSIVLLKNEDHILPVNKEDICFIGDMAKNIRYQGAGSSHINPYKLTSPLDYLDIPYTRGCDEDGNANDELIYEAKELAKKYQKVVLFIGLCDQYESEGFDRENMSIPDGHLRLVNELSKVNPNIVVVLLAGSSVSLPFIDSIKGLLYAGLAGESAGEAIVDILLGKENPSGKLAESWIKEYKDHITSPYYKERNPLYREGIYVGYRYFDKANIDVNYPFGYGLSYSNFEYTNLKYQDDILSFNLKNNSDIDGKEIVELYIENPNGYRALRELKGFKKIYLKAHEEKIISFKIEKEMFEVFNEKWIIPKGNYKLEIGSSSRDIKLIKEINIDGEKDDYEGLSNWYYDLKGNVTDADFKTLYKKDFPEFKIQKGQFTMENTLTEMKDYSLIMKLMYIILEIIMAKANGGKDTTAYKMMMSSSADCSFNGLKICGQMNNYVLEGMLMIANGHFYKGLVQMFKRH